MQLLPWIFYSPGMLPTEQVWDLVGWRFHRDQRPSASKGKVWQRIQVIWNFLPQVDIQNLFDSMPRRKAILTAGRSDYTRY